jgi:hypothetical protein
MLKLDFRPLLYYVLSEPWKRIKVFSKFKQLMEKGTWKNQKPE